MSEPAFEIESMPIPDMPDSGAVHVRGRVTYDEAPDFRRSILDELSRTTVLRMVLDLGGVDEMDTSGAAVLAEALKLGSKRGVRVLLCRPSESVLRIFRLAGFEEVLDHCCADRSEAQQRLLE